MLFCLMICSQMSDISGEHVVAHTRSRKGGGPEMITGRMDFSIRLSGMRIKNGHSLVRDARAFAILGIGKFSNEYIS